MRSLVDHERGEESFLDEVLRRSFVTSMDPETSSYRFFEVVADVVCTSETFPLSFGHVFCLGIANLCRPLVNTRRLALAALEAVHNKSGGTTGLSTFEAGVGSSAANIYLDAQFNVSCYLSEEHPEEAVNVIVQCA